MRVMYEVCDCLVIYFFLMDGDMNIIEGFGFNVCFFKDGKLYIVDRGVFEGVICKSVFDVVVCEGIFVKCEIVLVRLVYEVDEILMCIIVGGIMLIM